MTLDWSPTEVWDGRELERNLTFRDLDYVVMMAPKLVSARIQIPKRPNGDTEMSRGLKRCFEVWLPTIEELMIKDDYWTDCDYFVYPTISFPAVKSPPLEEIAS